MTSKLQICILLLLSLLLSVAKAKSPKYAMPNCNDTCGGMRIAYPFGMGDSTCFFDPWFEIDCRLSPSNHSNSRGSNFKPFISKLNLEVVSINGTQVEVFIPPLRMCSTKNHTEIQQYKSIDLSSSPYSYSADENLFMMEGCPGSAILFDESNITTVGCGTVCHSMKNREIPTNGCFGVNCCQTPLTSRDHSIQYSTLPFYEIEFMLQPSEVENCLVGSLIHSGSLSDYVGKLSHSIPVIALRWSWPFGHFRPCSYSHTSPVSIFSMNCKCDMNYDGNPYVPDGCQAPGGCEGCRGECLSRQNSSGHHTYYCEHRPLLHLAAILGLGYTFGFLLLVACLYGLYQFINRRRELKRRANFFKRNGGLLLKQQLLSNEGTLERTKIFTISELEKATDRFNENRILGQGGQGTVYKGMLTDGSIVAIKKARLLDESQLEQFINEVVILSLINHRHVVKLYGCCLETEVPLLVYEFIPNGALFEHIHHPDEDFVISWDMRLKIAVDSACAIAYLHSSSSIPIYHRDIKSSNILLDEKYRAKVSDFGSSKTIAMDQTHLTTLVQGTMGYLDPEYFQSYQFTEKSDVYSFGVVILELLTSKKPIYREGSTMEQKNLVTEFLFLTQDSRLSKILDPKIIGEATEDALFSVIELAKRCVSWSGKLRPTMKEVAMTLEMIMKSPGQVSSWYQQQEDIPIQYAGYDEFDMGDAEFVWSTLPSGSGGPPCGDDHPLLPDSG